MAVRNVEGVLSIAEVSELLEVTDGTVECINKPKGGKVYVFSAAGKQECRADGYW